MNNITAKYKNKIIGMVTSGFVSGFCAGCFPNKVCIRFENKQYKSLPIPIITGFIGSMGIIFSPLLMINYLCNGVYFEKWIDQYNIHVERYHQYDGTDNKYAYPSLLIINIKSKNENDGSTPEKDGDGCPVVNIKSKNKNDDFVAF